MAPVNKRQLLDPHETFASLCTEVDLDVRLKKSIARQGYIRPTLVQSKCLTLAINSGRDLLVRARTGSGKTLAYCLPVLNKILQGKKNADNRSGVADSSVDEGNLSDHFVKAVILVPTRELCQQVISTLNALIFYCDEIVSVAVLAGAAGKKGGKNSNREMISAQEAMLRDKPDVIVSTPAGLLHHIKSGAVTLRQSVESLVVDEADLVLSYGYAKDVTEIMKALPKICQGYLMSATLSPELDALKRVVLHSPAILKLEEDDYVGRNQRKLMQFFLTLPKQDKQLVLYVFLKLGLLKGKGLFFVNSTDAGYRLKLFFEQFHIRSAVLNAELPLSSRLSIIEQFNADTFDYLIATDASTDVGRKKKAKVQPDTEENDEIVEHEQDSSVSDANKSSNDNKDQDQSSEKEIHSSEMVVSSTKDDAKEQKKSRGNKKDSEYGVSRGIDFRGVSFVVNVDFPETPESYTHRVGRTARGGAKGVAFSLVETDSTEQADILRAVQASQPPLPLAKGSDELAATSTEGVNDVAGQPQPSPLDFDLNEIEGFRYRVEDVGRAVTKIAVKEARAAELKAEILNSERLQDHFEENPHDLQLLRHDRQATHAAKVQDHLKHVPKYMLPRGMQVAEMNKRKRRRRNRNSGNNTNPSSRRTDNDPLQSYDGNVNLDGVAGNQDAEYFVDNLGSNADGDKKQSDNDKRLFMDTDDGTGQSTAGRNSWKERHNKGKFSNKRKKTRKLQYKNG